MGDSRNRMLNEQQVRKNMKKNHSEICTQLNISAGNERPFLWGKRCLAKQENARLWSSFKGG